MSRNGSPRRRYRPSSKCYMRRSGTHLPPPRPPARPRLRGSGLHRRARPADDRYSAPPSTACDANPAGAVPGSVPAKCRPRQAYASHTGLWPCGPSGLVTMVPSTMNELLCDDLWSTIRRLAHRAAVRRAAVAYVTSDEILRFSEGDVLVTDASDHAIAAGRPSAHVLQDAFTRKVRLYSLPE